MIVFDLACDNGHVFEAWFGSSDDYAKQKAGGLVSCPICNSAEIDKAVMAPRLAAKGNRDITPARSPEKTKEMMAMLAKAQAEALAQSDYVGKRFADEARAIHLGEATERSIYGEASREETRALLDEGIAVAPLIFPVAPPGEAN
jgi:hypothetical protein